MGSAWIDSGRILHPRHFTISRTYPFLSSCFSGMGGLIRGDFVGGDQKKRKLKILDNPLSISIIVKHTQQWGSQMSRYSWLIVVLLAVFVGTILGKPSSDFDGDGEVAFPDFLLFASKFGSTDSRFDLNQSGEVDFEDFVVFAAEFDQKEYAAKTITMPEELESQAKALRESGNYSDAIQKYEDFLAAVTDSVSKAKGLKEIGITYMAMDSLDSAEKRFKQALETYGESSNKAVQVQMVWSNAHLGIINHQWRDKFQTIVYLEQARTHFSSLNIE